MFILMVVITNTYVFSMHQYVKHICPCIRLARQVSHKGEGIPERFVLGAPSPAAAKKLRNDIEEMRQSGELEKIIRRMPLE